MNLNDLLLLAQILHENRHGQNEVRIETGFAAAAERLRRAGLIIGNEIGFIPTSAGEQAGLDLVVALRSVAERGVQ